jgi:hypothetical protein
VVFGALVYLHQREVLCIARSHFKLPTRVNYSAREKKKLGEVSGHLHGNGVRGGFWSMISNRLVTGSD